MLIFGTNVPYSKVTCHVPKSRSLEKATVTNKNVQNFCPGHKFVKERHQNLIYGTKFAYDLNVSLLCSKTIGTKLRKLGEKGLRISPT